MKKPRKPKTKAKRRAPSPAIAPRRALAPAPRARHAGRARRGTALASASRRLSSLKASGSASARRGWSELTSLAHRVSAADLRSPFENWRAPRLAVALPYSRDERQILLLLFLPILLVASALVAHQSMRTLYDYVTLAAIHGPDQEVAPIHPDMAKTVPPAEAEVPHESARPSVAREASMPASALRPLPGAPETETPTPAPPTILAITQAATGSADARPVTATTALAPSSRTLADIPAAEAPPAPAAQPTGPAASLALLNTAPAAGLRQPSIAPAPIEAFEADESGQPIRPGICTVADAERSIPVVTGALPVHAAAAASLTPEAFGLRLAEAAQAQTTGFIVYNDAYRSIAYPMGDVHHMFGVCTDVVVRAYRALGIDLQALVHQTRSGRGDRNIDHRRTEVLRRFFAAHGESLPISPFAEEYRPGDIVTYHRPQNRGSRSHIAVVSSEIAPSGRPMIVHNRGWGPQLEDALFVDKITGHYRYRGPAPVEEAAASSMSPAAGITAAALPIFLPAPAN